MKYFYDTCALLELQKEAFKEPFFISSITLNEIENIKTSMNKDFDIKYKARKLIHLLDENQDKYQVILFNPSFLDSIVEVEVNNDAKIIATVLYLLSEKQDVVFYTMDLACKSIAEAYSIPVKYLNDALDDEYTGFKVVEMENQELADFYSHKLAKGGNPFNLNIGEYLIIKMVNGGGKLIYKQTIGGLEEVIQRRFNSEFFGRVSPKDEYQIAAMDSLGSNTITMLRGSAGTGKSYLALGYLFDKLARREIDQIVIFCNTVATQGAAKLGFYPGSRVEKLLDSQIGNFLSSKLGGDRSEVERLINAGTIELLPLSDIRGYDTSGRPTGVYITEAQNLDIDLMKLALQRIGEDSVCIIDGDDTSQVDMAQYAGVNNGMKRLSQVFRGQDFYGEITLQYIYRSKIARIAELM